MGAAQSTSHAETINEVVAAAIVENVMGCSAGIEQDQILNLSGNVIGNRFEQSATVNVNCLQDLKNTTELQTKIANKIKQKAEADLIPLAGTSATVITRIKNHVATRLNIANIVKCAASVKQRQIITVEPGSNVVKNVFVQNANSTVNCIQKALNNMKFANGLVSETESAATTKFSTTAAIIIIVLFITIIIVGFLVLYIIKEVKTPSTPGGGGGGGGGGLNPQMMQQAMQMMPHK